MNVEPTNMPDWLRQRAKLSPDRPALTTGHETWTFGDLEDRAARTAGWLRSEGFDRGSRIGVLMRNSLAFVVLMHAVSRVGGILVPFNTRLTVEELKWQAGHARVDWVVADQDLLRIAEDGAKAAQMCRVVASTALGEGPALQGDLFNLADIHSILFTSGTTGRSKGAMLTYGNHWWSAAGSALNLGLREDDCWLGIMPLFHVGGLSMLLKSVIYGHPIVLHPGFEPAAVNAAIDAQGVTLVSMVSTMLQRVLDVRGDRPMPAHLRGVLLGGGPAPLALLERCARIALPVIQTYGLTETASQVATLAPFDALRKLGSAGKPLFPTELKVDSATSEIYVRGPSVTAGYLDDPAATERAKVDGWFRTGDLGYFDAEGYLYILDRRDDLIVSGGENVYPAEIESALLGHPDVVDAGVTAVPHAKWGQVPVAYVVRRGAVSSAVLRDYLAQRLARYKLPVSIRFVESLPRNAGGKLLRRSLLGLRHVDTDAEMDIINSS